MGDKGPIKLKDIDRAGSVVEQDRLTGYPVLSNQTTDEYDFIAYRNGVLKNTIEKYGKGNVLDAVFNMDAKISSLLVENEALEELVDWDALEEEEEDDDNV
jgi:hypothetical protein